VYRRVQEEGYYAFNDLHALMAYAGAGAAADVERVLDGLRVAAAGAGTNAELSRDVGEPLCRAFAAFAAGDHAAATDTLLRVRPSAQRFGGSNAQRDVIEWTLVVAAERAGLVELTAGLARARKARKPAALQAVEPTPGLARSA
jgi:hypothetical protein